MKFTPTVNGNDLETLYVPLKPNRVPPLLKSFILDMNNSPPKPATLIPVFNPILLTPGNSIIFE